ncbi:HNH endonuclease [Pseudomonas trivialis]|uniref:HNH endonuclease n=1 Tax=Pseudomonas trivialis TaxID=200450 RepID=UPI0030CEC1DF
MDYKFRPVTAGEMLFDYINNSLIGRKNLTQISNLEALQIGGRQHELSSYYAGILAANLLSRIIKKANRVVSDVESEKEHHKLMTHYFLRSLEIPRSPSGVSLDRLASLALEAEKTSRKAIISSVRSQFTITKVNYCYMCGTPVYEKTQNPLDKMELEHIWPQSFGGDSTVENLLPACPPCNGEKGSMILWQNAHIHSFTLKPEPSADELTSIKKKVKIAQHRREMFEYASNYKKTLKDAALAIGSFNFNEVSAIDRDDAVDFFNFQIKRRDAV